MCARNYKRWVLEAKDILEADIAVGIAASFAAATVAILCAELASTFAFVSLHRASVRKCKNLKICRKLCTKTPIIRRRRRKRTQLDA